MIRRSLFWGLTLILVGVVATLVVKTRKQAATPQLPRIVEVTQEAKPSLTRVLAPRDLEVAESGGPTAGTMTEKKGALSKESLATRSISLRNSGSVPYSNVQLKFSYVSRSGKPVGSRTAAIKGPVQPGVTVDSGEAAIRDIPRNAATFQVTILSADIGVEAVLEDAKEKK